MGIDPGLFVIAKGKGTTVSDDWVVLAIARELGMGVAIKGMHTISKETHSLPLRKATPFFPCSHCGIGKE